MVKEDVGGEVKEDLEESPLSPPARESSKDKGCARRACSVCPEARTVHTKHAYVSSGSPHQPDRGATPCPPCDECRHEMRCVHTAE